VQSLRGGELRKEVTGKKIKKQHHKF